MNRPIPVLKVQAEPPSTHPSNAPSQGARLEHARLVMRDGRNYGALMQEGALWVTAAAGCLLQPEVGDLVLVSIAAGRGYVLTVLERGTPESVAQIEFPGDLRLSLPSGQLHLSAAAGLSLDAGPSLTVSATQASVSVAQAELSCGTMRIDGGSAHTNWKSRTDVSGERLEIAARSETHLQQSVRHIAGHEDMLCGSLRQTVTEDWSVHAATAELRGRDRVSVDAELVQIG